MTDKRVVLVTCSSAREAKRIGRALVEARLAACANIFSAPVLSIYRWKGKVESARESLLILKTTKRKFLELQSAVERIHSYEVPEIVALPIAEGSEAYLRWIKDSTSKTGRKGRRSK